MKKLVIVLGLFSATAFAANIVGVGMALDKTGTEYIKIGNIGTGTPAAENPQLKSGMIIRAVFNGKKWIDLKGTTMEKAVSLLRGEVGTQVAFKVSESDNGPTQEITLQRRDLGIPKAN